MNKEHEVITRKILKEEFKIERSFFKEELRKQFDDFAVIVSGAFSNQQKYMDGRFERIETRLDKVEGRLDNVENGLKRVEEGLDKVEYKVDGLQDQMEISNKNQKRFEKRIDKLETATI